MSEVATYLKLGTTALVLDMIEDGFFDRDYSLQSPVQAIRDISHDPTLREAITLKDGRTITALQIQLEYLECATRYVDSISPDPATKDVLARWADVLTKLESDRSEEHTSELQSPCNLVCRLLLEKKKNIV